MIKSFVICLCCSFAVLICTQTAFAQHSLSVIDTAISIQIPASNLPLTGLTKAKAKSILYKHFISKGYLTDDLVAQRLVLNDTDADKLSVDFDTKYSDLFFITNGGRPFAIITYWLAPPLASGHCFQPHKAIITKTVSGYKITNEDFIPDRFSIKHITNTKGRIIIHATDYQCANHIDLRKLRIDLITK